MFLMHTHFVDVKYIHNCACLQPCSTRHLQPMKCFNDNELTLFPGYLKSVLNMKLLL